MLRVGQDKIGECTFEVTLRYFHTAESVVFNALKYVDVRYVSGKFGLCREQAIERVLQQNGPHPMRAGPFPLALYRNTLTWDGPATWVQFYDEGFSPQQTFHVIYQDTNNPLLRKGGDQVLIPESLIRH